MLFGKFLRTAACAAIVLAGLQLDAAADPITPQVLTSGVTASGDLPAGDYYDALNADFYMFWATAGDPISLNVSRVDEAFDPAMWVYRGQYFDTSDSAMTAGTDYFQTWVSGFIAFADDEISNPGPYGDPYKAFSAPATGWYTVAVTEYFSDPIPSGSTYDYNITMRGATGSPPRDTGTVPEPTLLALLTCGACGVFVSRRRKSA